MKLASTFIAVCLAQSAMGFAPSSPAFVRQSTQVGSSGMDLSGNSWKPDSEKMGSTDTGDFFPEGYDPNEVEYTAGMMGSQGAGNNDRGGPQLPGMENLGEDAVMMGGIEQAEGIPEGMEFIPSSVPDGELSFQVAGSSSGMSIYL